MYNEFSSKMAPVHLTLDGTEGIEDVKENTKMKKTIIIDANDDDGMPLEGRTITDAKVDGFGVELWLEGGWRFKFEASDGGYSYYSMWRELEVEVNDDEDGETWHGKIVD